MMKVIQSNGESVAIEVMTEDEVWDAVKNGTGMLGDDFPGKVILTQKDGTLLITFVVYVPKVIKEGKNMREYIKKEKKRVDFFDAILMNRTLQQIFDYRLTNLFLRSRSNP